MSIQREKTKGSAGNGYIQRGVSEKGDKVSAE